MYSKIQVRLRNFILFSFLILFLASATGPDTDIENTDRLQARADSLFQKRQYTESLEDYQRLFSKEQVASPAMLMKMAFIQESRGDYSEALYYLNEYYLLTSDEKAAQKMQQLSEEHSLKGYQYTDYDLFYRYFREYRQWVIYALLALAMLGLIYLAATQRRREGRPYGWGVTYFLLLGAIFFVVNYADRPHQAIIMKDYTYIMDAPSPGAEVRYVSEKGHRVKVKGQEDVWMRIEWEGKPAFVRQGNLRAIQF